MKSIPNIFFSYCRSNAYLIVGICFGLCVSSFLAPVDIGTCPDKTNNSRIDLSSDNAYEPQINLEGKPLRAKKTPQVFMRPRYYSTELGIRDKLFIGIITSNEYLHSRGVARNKTMAHHVDKIRYFISIPEGARPNVTLPGIVGFTDTRSILKPFHVLKYITDNYFEDYDYYFLVNDLTYVDVRRLTSLVNKISISRDVHLGVASEVETFCSLDLGVLLSNSVVRKIKSNLDWCVKNTFSDSDDVNFGRCVVHSTSLPCSDTIQGQSFRATVLETPRDLMKNYQDSSKNYSQSVSTYPIFDSATAYKLNAYVARKALEAIEEEIEELRRKIPKTKELSFDKDASSTWPLGNQLGNKPGNRFDVIRWMYFNETHKWMESGGKNIMTLEDSTRIDIEYVMRAAINRMETNNYNGRLKYKKLLNGYRGYDASRGMDYILDMVFSKIENGEEVVKRVQVCKPLGKVEILPVPYVTENARLHLILIIDESQKAESIKFMEYYAQTCMERKDKTFLMVVLLYNPNSPSKGKEDVFHDVKEIALSLTEKYKKDQSKVAWLSIRLDNVANSIDAEPARRIAVADLIVKKFSADSLILFIETGMELNIDYLNRVRMNTISQWQVFSPIPFTEYHPDVAYSMSKVKDELDINRSCGRYDDHNFNHVSFYAKDYAAVRKISEPTLPIVRADRDISNMLKLARENDIDSIFELFARYSDLHCFRGLEPALKIKHKEIDCGAERSDSSYKDCVETRRLNLGNRGQLARLILNFKQDQ